MRIEKNRIKRDRLSDFKAPNVTDLTHEYKCLHNKLNCSAADLSLSFNANTDTRRNNIRLEQRITKKLKVISTISVVQFPQYNWFCLLLATLYISYF